MFTAQKFTSWNIASPKRGVLLCLAVAATISGTAHAQTTAPRFAYFMDNFTDANLKVEVPPGTTLIGWANATQRTSLAATGRVVGTSTAMSSNGGSKIMWSDPGMSPAMDLKHLFNTATPPDLSTPAARQQFASLILAAASVDPSGFPAAVESMPTASGGYAMWCQDIEGPMAVPEETASAITAVMWAGRELLGPNMKVIPVPASVIQKQTATGWDLKAVLSGSASDNFVKFLGLRDTLSSSMQAQIDANAIDLLSMLHLVSAEGHVLIDGILAQQYSASGCDNSGDCPVNCTSINCGALPGQLSSDTPTFFDATLPYAILSAHDCPSQLFLAPPIDGCPGQSNAAAPWSSIYRGAMPFQAGVYWNQVSIDPVSVFDPLHYLTPTAAVSGDVSGGESCPSDLEGNRWVDGQDLGIMLALWGVVPPGTRADLNADMRIDGQDLAQLLAAWGECPNGAPQAWISVLVAQEVPPTSAADLQTYVQKIQKLAPALEQIHLRFAAGATNYQTYADLITLLRTAYGSTLKIGFHPDNSNSSCAFWGCTAGDCAPTSPATWHCVLDASIAAMNAINQIADPQQSGQGFSIFSLEQSPVEDVSTTPVNSLAAIKACLTGNAQSIPGVRPASPPVTFGNVGPSYGGPEVYGATGFDFGFPQYYNLGKRITSDYSALVSGSDSFFPAYSAADCILPAQTYPYMVVDVDSNGAYASPKIPCFGATTTPNVYMYTDPATGSGPSPTLVAAYVAFLMTQYPPISNTVPLSGSTVFITFSGEPEFLGSPGWTIDKINQFNTELVSNFTYLKANAPGLFPPGGTDPQSLKYGLWNFDSILQQITLP